MRPSYPGFFLTSVALLTFVGFGASLYFRWESVAALFAPLVLCHLGIFYRSRAAGWGLITLYSLACGFLVLAFFTHSYTISTSLGKLVGKLVMNLAVIYEVRRWLAEQF